MSIDLWGLGLQALNVLILVWLLARVFWRPVAAAIAARQAATQAVLRSAKDTQAKADTALDEVRKSREGIAKERAAVLADAATKADIAAKATLTEARDKADTLLNATQTAVTREREAARKENAVKAATLAVEIAKKLLARFEGADLQPAFLELLLQAIDDMPAASRAALVAAKTPIEIVTPSAPMNQAALKAALTKALGGAADLKFSTNPDLLAGIELRTPHFTLHNSWRADLDAILSEVRDAA